jgi:hypothetical protein
MDTIKLFDLLAEISLSPNQYYLLWCMKNKVEPKNINVQLELRILVNEGYVEGVKLTEKAQQLLSDDSMNVKIPDSLLDNIDKYLNIFPKGKLPSGKPARVNKRNIEEAFKWFFKNYKYEWYTILAGTEYYVNTFEKENFKFMRNSQYFIRKQNSDKSWDSELANCCDIILSGDDQDNSPHFSEKVV